MDKSVLDLIFIDIYFFYLIIVSHVGLYRFSFTFFDLFLFVFLLRCNWLKYYWVNGCDYILFVPSVEPVAEETPGSKEEDKSRCPD